MKHVIVGLLAMSVLLSAGTAWAAPIVATLNPSGDSYTSYSSGTARGVPPPTGTGDAFLQLYTTSAYFATPYDGGKAYIKFDLSSLPAGATITDVTLNLHYTPSVTGSSNTVGIMRADKNWTEAGLKRNLYDGTSSWDHPYVQYKASPLTWGNAGGDWTDATGTPFGTSPYATATMVGPSGFPPAWSQFNSTALTGLVQAWYDGSVANQGLVAVITAGTSSGTYKIDSREAADTSVRPQLVVTYNVTPEPITLALVAASFGMLTLRRRTA